MTPGRLSLSRDAKKQVGQHYLAAHWGQQLMTVSEFIDRHILTHGAIDGDSGPGELAVSAEVT